MNLRDAGDPVEIAKIYDEQGADELTFLDITASHEERGIILDIVRRTAEQVFMPLTVGGGIKVLDDIRNLLLAGCDKVSINTTAVHDPEFIKAASMRFGSQCIVVAIDAKRVSAPGAPPRWEIFTHGGRRPTGIEAIGYAREVAALGAGEILFDLDGSRRVEAGLRPRAHPRRRRRGRHSRHRLGRGRQSRPPRRGRKAGPRQRRAGGVDIPFRRIYDSAGEGPNGGSGRPGTHGLTALGVRWAHGALRFGPPQGEPRMPAARDDTHFGRRTVPLEEKQGLVDDVFHKVASRYDLMNDLMSLGLHRAWKDALVAKVRPSLRRPFAHVDVAGGTGDVAMRVAQAGGPLTTVTLVDVNADMLRVAEERAATRSFSSRLTFVEANAEALPLADSRFDAYTIAFGIRNVPRIDAALSEAYRVLRRGGRFLCLEFSHVDLPMVEQIYDAYSFTAIPALGKVVTGDGAPYRYLVESIRKFPSPDLFAEMIGEAGFARVDFARLSGGIVAIHSGWKL